MTRYPSFLFRDPLLKNNFLVNNRTGPPSILTNNIDIQVDGDHLLNLYIDKLDEEIFRIKPEGLGDLGETVWVMDDWDNLSIKLMNESRKHSFCVIQFYDDDSFERWRVFSVQEFTEFIKEEYKDDDGNSKQKLIGMKFEWGDYLGNQFKEEALFDDPMTHLIKFREGDGRSVFAFPDLTQAIMTLNFEFRQSRGQMVFSAAKPSFLHFVYGMAANTDSIDELDTKIKGVDVSSAIGISKDVLEEIRNIENTNLQVVIPALDKQIQYFSGLTRLPVSYYLGEKQGSGMSDMGEKIDMLKIRQKKEALFNHYEPYIIKIFKEVYDITILKLELPKDASLEEIEQDNDSSDTETPTESDQNGQED